MMFPAHVQLSTVVASHSCAAYQYGALIQNTILNYGRAKSTVGFITPVKEAYDGAPIQEAIPSVSNDAPLVGSKLPVIKRPLQEQSKCKPISGKEAAGAPGAMIPV
jgi:hypothetical protein